MNPWLDQFIALLQVIFNASTATTVLYIQAGVAFFFFCFTLRLSGWALHVGYATWPRLILSIILVIGLPLGLALSFQVLATPQLPASIPVSWVLGSMIAILLLGIVLPLLTFLLKTGFIQIVMMIAFSAFAGFIAALLVLFLSGALQRGATDFSKAEQRRNAIDSAISEPLTQPAVKP
jgi:hypothetical protein